MSYSQESRVNEVPLPDTLPELPDIGTDYEREAYTHSSAGTTANPESYERLAILGNAALNAAVTLILFESFDKKLEKGRIDEIRRKCVANSTVEAWARAYNFQTRIQVSPRAQISLDENRTIPREAFHAFLAAIWLKMSMDRLTDFVRALLVPVLAGVIVKPIDRNVVTKLRDKTKLMGLADPEFLVTKDEAADLEECFIAQCRIGDTCVGRGVGRSKKVAQWNAAQEAMRLDARQLAKSRKVTVASGGSPD